MNDLHCIRICEILITCCEGRATKEDLLELERMLDGDKEAIEYYVECLMDIDYFYSISEQPLSIPTDLSSSKNFYSLSNQNDQMAFLASLAEYEKTAPELEIPKEKPQRELIRKVVYPSREKRKMSTFSKVFLVLNAAAILFIILFLSLTPPKGGIEVATLTDSINAKWADATGPMQRGIRLYNDKPPLLLREGFVEIKFDNNAQVTIEGPAEFQILDGDMMKLNYGQLYSQVPEEAYGFQVGTQYAKVIDLGTEFGIKEEIDGDTEVHVLKGKVNFVSGILNKKINLDLPAGSARELNAQTGELKGIPCKDNLFVRQIESNSNVIWRGQDTIPLTNLLAGTLFKEVPGGIEINPATGKHVIHENYVSGLERQGGTEYHITDSPFVDGTFIPSGPLRQTISSTNLTWQSPKTSGFFFYNLSDRETVYDPYTGSHYPLSLTPNDIEKASLLFHPNAGLTLDLDKIRQKIPTLQIQRFRADCGISDAMNHVLEKIRLDGNISDQKEPTMDFTVLLDGKVCKTLTGITLDSGINKIDVEIHPADRFLTLVSTDGDLSYEFDWFVLADPVLVLK